MAKICLCLTAKTLKRNLEILDKYRQWADLAELRVDCLDPDERFMIRRFPEQAGLPVILTIRRTIDGGNFFGGEGARVNLLARGLAYADANRRMNFAYVDIEEDLNVPSLEEAARTFGTRIIRSWHNMDGYTGDIAAKIRGMKCMGDDLVKIAVRANSTADVLRILRASRGYSGKEKIFFCTGQYGAYSRILAEQFGSFLSYTSAPGENDIVKGCESRIDVQELAELYRFHNISPSTKIFGAVCDGDSLLSSDAIRYFNAVFKLDDIDAVYAPFCADSITNFMELANELNISGVSVCGSYMEEAVHFLNEQFSLVESTGVCDTIFRSAGGWTGTNVIALGWTNSFLEWIGRKDLRRKKVTLIGGGSMAKIIANELYRLNAGVLILNRSVLKARHLAGMYKFTWGGFDNAGIKMMEKYRDIIILAAPEEFEGSGACDPLDMYAFCGREAVMELVDKPEPSRFLIRAAEAGCRIINGHDAFVRQAHYQYEQFMEKDFPPHILARVEFGRS